MSRLPIFPISAYFIVLLLFGFTQGLTQYLFIILLGVPLLDKQWTAPNYFKNKIDIIGLLLLFIISFVLFFFLPEQLKYFLTMLVFTALPEEWFFRAYLLDRFGGNVKANIISSVLFSLLHAITRGPIVALEVFFPSLIYGWVFLKTKSVIACIIVHAISNILFVFAFNQCVDNIRNFLNYSI